MDEYKKKLSQIISDKTYSSWSMAEKVLLLLDEAEDCAPVLLEQYIEETEDLDFREYNSDKQISKEEEDSLYDEFSENGVLENVEQLISQQLEPQDFYARLWKFIKSSSELKTKKRRQFMIYIIRKNVRMPYYSFANGMKMSDDDYRKLVSELKTSIAQARFIVFSKYEQQTEASSHLLRLLSEQKDFKSKVVLLSVIIRFIELKKLIVDSNTNKTNESES